MPCCDWPPTIWHQGSPASITPVTVIHRRRSRGAFWHRPVQEAKPVLRRILFGRHFRYDRSVRTRRRERRAPYSPSPSGGFAQQLKIERRIDKFISIKIQ